MDKRSQFCDLAIEVCKLSDQVREAVARLDKIEEVLGRSGHDPRRREFAAHGITWADDDGRPVP